MAEQAHHSIAAANINFGEVMIKIRLHAKQAGGSGSGRMPP